MYKIYGFNYYYLVYKFLLITQSSISKSYLLSYFVYRFILPKVIKEKDNDTTYIDLYHFTFCEVIWGSYTFSLKDVGRRVVIRDDFSFRLTVNDDSFCHYDRESGKTVKLFQKLNPREKMRWKIKKFIRTNLF